jgi:uncharacterized membrane protein YbhN (UPF0104 family)
MLRLLPLVALCLGLAGLGLLFLQARPGHLAEALSAFDARLIPPLLALATGDYAVRFWRWRLLVKVTAGASPPLTQDLACFLAANTLLLTPARAGDFSRSAYAALMCGTPAAKTAPVPVMERLVDVVLMASFAAGGTLAFGLSPAYAAGGSVLAVLGTTLLFNGRVNKLALRLFARVGGAGLVSQASSFLQSLGELGRPRALAIALGLGALAWFLECAAFFVVLYGLGFEPGVELAGQAVFIYPVANLAGSLSLVPGGLGVAEGSTAALTTALIPGATASAALAAGLLIRLSIVGFGIVTGLPGLLYVTNRIGRMQTRREARGAQAA